MSPTAAIQKSDIKSIMTKYTDNTPDEGDVEAIENREYEYADVKGKCKWVFNREFEDEEEEEEEEEEKVEKKKAEAKAKAPKKEKKTKEDVWVTFKKKIVNGDDIDECIEMVKNELAATAVKAVTVKAVKGKRKPSSYNNFVSKTMMDMKKDETLSAKDRLSTAAKMWKALSEDEKKEFKANDTEDDASDSQM